MDRLLTIKQLSESLQVKESTLYYWVHIGFVPHIKLGKCVRFRDADIMKWIEKREQCGRMHHKVSV